MNKTPRAVITSNKAKEHIINARSAMDEMNLSISIHKQNMDNKKMQADKLQQNNQQEIERINMQNQHEMAMQTQKLNAVNSLI